MTRHAQLQKLGKGDAKVDENKGECSICLGDVAVSSFLFFILSCPPHGGLSANIFWQPCQSLFIAACAHVWHYKCIRRMLMGSSYPQFTCPNCRAITDLEAELEAEDVEEWEQTVDEAARPVGNLVSTHTQLGPPFPAQQDTVHAGGAAIAYDEVGEVDLGNIQFEGHGDPIATPPLNTSGLLARRQTSHGTNASQGTPVTGMMEMPGSSTGGQLGNLVTNQVPGTLATAIPTAADVIGGEGPLTPRNDAGPFVFDGSGGRASDRRLTANDMDESD